MKKRGFWVNTAKFCREFISKPQGRLGLIILGLFIFVAVAAPILTPYDPIDDLYLAEGMAKPAWAKILPGNSKLPVTVHTRLGFNEWQVASGEDLHNAEEIKENAFAIKTTPGEFSKLVHEVNYKTDPPGNFHFETRYSIDASEETTTVLAFVIVDPNGKEWRLWEKKIFGSLKPQDLLIDSRQLDLKTRLGLTIFDEASKVIFAKKGQYKVLLRAYSEGEPAIITMEPVAVNIQGKLHGVLGADHMGGDLWSQLIYGARISLIIGIVAALIAVFIGTAIGIASGYIGGFVDEFFMRLADVMLSIPTMPVLIILSSLIGKNIWNVVILIALFSWTSTARIVRSQTLTLKERAFVEAARASGASKTYTMLVHILPNVIPLVFAALVLLIPGAIFYEATLSFLGLGDPTTPTWGRMLHNARSFGAFTMRAWWWILPPGLAITLLSLSFVFIGNTLDEILNPRNKERA